MSPDPPASPKASLESVSRKSETLPDCESESQHARGAARGAARGQGAWGGEVGFDGAGPGPLALMAGGGAADRGVQRHHPLLAGALERGRTTAFRVAGRLGLGGADQPAHPLLGQVLFRLRKVEEDFLGLPGGEAGRAREAGGAREARAQERAGRPLCFSCNVLLLGRAGVGKTRLIDELVRYPLTKEGPGGTEEAVAYHGETEGVQIHFLDTPGLSACHVDRGRNVRILRAVKRLLRAFPPDIVLYVDRLDRAVPALPDVHLLRTIGGVLGEHIWSNTMIVLTHGNSLPFDEASGEPSEFESVRNWRCHGTQAVIRHSTVTTGMTNPAALVELHAECETDERGEKLLVNGRPWRQTLLMHCCVSKILREASAHFPGSSEAGGGGAKAVGPGRPHRFARFMPLGHMISGLLASVRPVKVRPGRPPAPDRGPEFPWVEAYPNFPFALAQQSPDWNPTVPAPDPNMQPRFDCDTASHGYRYRYLEGSQSSWVCRAVVDADWYDHQDGMNGFTAESLHGNVGQAGERSVPVHTATHVAMPENVLETGLGRVDLTLAHDEERSVVAMGEIQHFGGEGTVLGVRVDGQKHLNETSKTTVGLGLYQCGKDRSAAAENALGYKIEHGIDASERLQVAVRAASVRSFLARAPPVSVNGLNVGAVYTPQDGTQLSGNCTIVQQGGENVVSTAAECHSLYRDHRVVVASQLSSAGQANLGLKASSTQSILAPLLLLVPLLPLLSPAAAP